MPNVTSEDEKDYGFIHSTLLFLAAAATAVVVVIIFAVSLGFSIDSFNPILNAVGLLSVFIAAFVILSSPISKLWENYTFLQRLDENINRESYFIDTLQQRLKDTEEIAWEENATAQEIQQGRKHHNDVQRKLTKSSNLIEEIKHFQEQPSYSHIPLLNWMGNFLPIWLNPIVVNRIRTQYEELKNTVEEAEQEVEEYEIWVSRFKN